MFAESANKLEDLPYGEIDQQMAQIKAMGGRSTNDFLAWKFPTFQKHYQGARKMGHTTWDIQPSVQVGLFQTIHLTHRPNVLDHILAYADPKPDQTLGAEEIQRGLDAINGKSPSDLANWRENEGRELKFEVYER